MNNIEKYPAELVSNRQSIEYSFVFSICKDLEQLDNYIDEIEVGKDFMLDESQLYLGVAIELYKKGVRVPTDIDFMSFLEEKKTLFQKYEDYGGFSTIKEIGKELNQENLDSYWGDVCKWNLILEYHDNGNFNVVKNIDKLKKMINTEQVADYFEYQAVSVGLNKSKSCNIQTLTLDDNFIKSCENGEELGFSISKKCPILNSYTMGIHKASTTLLGGYSGCVDADTEFFNGKEWKRIVNYDKNDMVLQYNKDKSATLVYPQQYHKYPAKTLTQFESKYGINQVLSDEHNVVYYGRRHENIIIKSFKEIKDKHVKTKKGFSGRFITHFSYGDKGIDLTNEQIMLQVAVIADGTINEYGDKPCRFHIKKDRKKQRLRYLFELNKIDYREKESAVDGYVDFYIDPPTKEKTFGAHWYKCTQEQLKIIADECLLWDSSPTNNKKIFSTNDKASADFIQFAFSSNGMRARVSRHNRVSQKYITGEKEYERKTEEYQVTVAQNSGLVSILASGDKKIRMKDYQTRDGFKYCFTVESSMLVLRRDGCIFITGNSGKTSYIIDNYLVPLLEMGEKCSIAVNEQGIGEWKQLFLANILYNQLEYYKLPRQSVKKGKFMAEHGEYVKKAQAYFDENYKDKIFFIRVDGYDINEVKKAFRYGAKRGHSIGVYDTFKSGDSSDTNYTGKLIEDSKQLLQVAIKQDMAIIITMQLAIHTEGIRYLTSSCLSGAKGVKEVMSEVVLMRSVWADEFDGEKYDIRPYRHKKVDGKYTQEHEIIRLDPNRKYRILFLDKTRNSEGEIALVYQFDGAWNKWVELGFCIVGRERTR